MLQPATALQQLKAAVACVWGQWGEGVEGGEAAETAVAVAMWKWWWWWRTCMTRLWRSGLVLVALSMADGKAQAGQAAWRFGVVALGGHKKVAAYKATRCRMQTHAHARTHKRTPAAHLTRAGISAPTRAGDPCNLREAARRAAAARLPPRTRPRRLRPHPRGRGGHGRPGGYPPAPGFRAVSACACRSHGATLAKHTV